MSGNPLFISIFSRATSQPLTSILRTQRDKYEGIDPYNIEGQSLIRSRSSHPVEPY